MNLREDPYRPAWWLPGPHLQSGWGPLRRPRGLVAFRREALPTPDGDVLLLDHAEVPAPAARALLLHGLEGSSFSVYVQGLLRGLAARGWSGTVLNFRSCARDPSDIRRMIPNLRPRFYHSGETEDAGFVLRTLAAREPSTPLFAVGASLGANVLLKWLGENPDQRILAGAAAISTPFDLAAGSRHLEKGAGRFYVRHFLRTLRPKALAVLRRFPELGPRIDAGRIRRARTFRQFDDAATAPLHGFSGAGDYYSRSSSLDLLSRIRTPVLCISSEDDPFLPAETLLRARASASRAVEFLVTRAGGHIGFVSGGLFEPARYWAEERVVEWLEAELLRRSTQGT